MNNVKEKSKYASEMREWEGKSERQRERDFGFLLNQEKNY